MRGIGIGGSLVVAALLAVPVPGSADQWVVLHDTDGPEAVALLTRGTLLVSYCSLHDGEVVEVLLVEGAKYVPWRNPWAPPERVSVFVAARRLLRAETPFPRGGYDAFVARFAPVSGWPLATMEIDLAYTFIEQAPNAFAPMTAFVRLPTWGASHLELPDAAYAMALKARAVLLDAGVPPGRATTRPGYVFETRRVAGAVVPPSRPAVLPRRVEAEVPHGVGRGASDLGLAGSLLHPYRQPEETLANPDAERIIGEARHLPLEARAALAARLMESLGDHLGEEAEAVTGSDRVKPPSQPEARRIMAP